MKDSRKRKWINKKCDAAKLLQLLIASEDIFDDLDDYQMANFQNYPEIEDMMLQITMLRIDYAKYIDEHPELLEIKVNKCQTKE
jgi:hypothetical protein